MANIVDFIFDSQKVRTMFLNGEPYFVAKDVCDVLGYKNTAVAIQDNCNKKGVATALALTKGGKQKVIVINESNVKLLIIKSQKKTENEKELIVKKYFPHLESSFVFERKEISFVSDLTTVLSAAKIEIETQKKVLSYRIDIYLPKYKLAIEFDESNHKYQVEQDIKRQKEIETYLGCNFIRLSEKESNLHNIGLIIKTITK